jgi:coenzyme F420-reducing hydrogenase beta subunit
MNNEKTDKANVSIVKSFCAGCALCEYICIAKCIQMEADKEGFLKPTVREDECINCGKCLHFCPSINELKADKPIMSYATASKDTEITKKSASAGVFFYVAKYIIECLHGYVCGAVLDEQLNLKHIITNDMFEVSKMQGSKYIQSSIGCCYQQLHDILKQGHPVLFTGTPCQVAALKRLFVNENGLFLIDLICHGVPSNNGFKQYMRDYYNLTECNYFSFRQKDQHTNQMFAFAFINKDPALKPKTKIINALDDPFYSAFIHGDNYRECCYICKYAQERRIGDLTIGDCANRRAYNLPLDKVLSTVIINTKKGQLLWDAISEKMEYVTADYKKEVEMNKTLHAPTIRSDKRDNFYDDLFINRYKMKELKSRYCPKITLRERIIAFIINHTTVQQRRKLFKKSNGCQ